MQRANCKSGEPDAEVVAVRQDAAAEAAGEDGPDPSVWTELRPATASANGVAEREAPAGAEPNGPVDRAAASEEAVTALKERVPAVERL